ncbi:MAG: ABC transporter permease [Planctomycetota bacterium]|jgi:ABC-2 type transport system permease protein
MGETMTAAAVLRSDRPGAVGFAIGGGAGVLAGALGGAVGLVANQIVLAFGADTASLPSAVTRVLLAGLMVAVGVFLANRDLINLPIGAGCIVGSAAGTVFGLKWGLVLGPASGIVGAALALTQVPPLTRRELNAYFCSPIAYIVGTVFLIFFGLTTFFSLLAGAEATLSASIGWASWVSLPILTPLLTMRLLAEEKRSGTIEVLMTAPVNDWEVVTSKFLAALAAFAAMLVPTLVHVLALYLVSEKGPAAAPLVGGYLGMALTAALFLSLGLLASALSRDQIVAAIVGYAFSFCVFLLGAVEWMADRFGWAAGNERAQQMLRAVSYSRHFGEFSRGNIDSRGIVFFVSLTVFALFLAVRAVESRKWR